MGIANWFIEGFGAAITDIRQKVVEEGWFGREVTQSSQDANLSATLDVTNIGGLGAQPGAVVRADQTLSSGLNWASMPADLSREVPEKSHGPEIER